ncbi:MAG: hypothetical protein JRH20_24520 [Deltaproteobacteria bacterium]|nr:hypothetical protein [Deltaproteobacteria bacterium]
MLTLTACGGRISVGGVGESPFTLAGDGLCELPDGSACLFNNELLAPTEDDVRDPNVAELPPEEGGCWVTGIGTFGKALTRDSFGGNAMTMKDGSVRGEWQHTDHYDELEAQKNGQNLFHGKVTYIACQRYDSLNGPEVPKAEPNFANWGGSGRFNGEDGYFFDVQAFDHAEGGIHHDRYVIRIFAPDKTLVLAADGLGTLEDPSNKQCLEDETVLDGMGLDWVKAMGCLSGGNFQIHPPNKGHPY